jgi:hypothetical protein
MKQRYFFGHDSSFYFYLGDVSGTALKLLPQAKHPTLLSPTDGASPLLRAQVT